MSYGLEIRNASGVPVFSSASPLGGVFVGKFTQSATASAGTVTTWTFDGTGGKTDIGPASVRVIQIGAGAHNFTVSGNQVIFTQRTRYAGSTFGNTTTLLVFAI